MKNKILEQISHHLLEKQKSKTNPKLNIPQKNFAKICYSFYSKQNKEKESLLKELSEIECVLFNDMLSPIMDIYHYLITLSESEYSEVASKAHEIIITLDSIKMRGHSF
ncbi:hypothetical protein DID75_05010 [Candidatus Marinamargulisbacteria bacterium SCGC AG-410-N11]|nr:hypothetical protein DID75_05010 [Candidatus Marinamargulisbacteria bacterium SCGC AG-410-N11]